MVHNEHDKFNLMTIQISVIFIYVKPKVLYVPYAWVMYSLKQFALKLLD